MSKVVQKTVIICIVAFCAILLPFVSPASATNSSNASTTVAIKPSLTISIPTTTIIMNLDPANHAFDEKDLTVSVGTNNPTGYQLTVGTVNDANNLVNAADITETIPSLSTTYSAANFPANYWGYRLSNGSTSSGDYGQFTSGSVVSESEGPVNNATKTLGFASKVDFTKPSGSYQLNLDFKVLPIITQEYMQNLDLTICTETPTVVIDSRDEQLYTIQRLKDGKCWMTQNLRLGKNSDSLTLTTGDSDTQSGGFTLNGKLPTGGAFTSKTIGGVQYVNDSSEYYCTENYGCYYNWYTATAGSGNYNTSSSTVNYSICPAGWTLPTQADALNLISLYSGTTAAGAATMLVDNPTSTVENINGVYSPGLLLGGCYSDTGPYSVGGYGFYQTSTATSNKSTAYRLHISLAGAGASNTTYKFYGQSIRCVAR